MKKVQELLKKMLPYISILVIFIAISFIYFSPVIEGKVLPQMDNIHAVGMAKELRDFSQAHPGEDCLWTNSMFGGMPAFQILVIAKSYNIFLHLSHVIRLGLPPATVAILFLLLVGFFVLLISLGVDKWLSLAGSIAFAFASYNFIIIGAGHITKAYAIALMAPVLAGVILTYKKKYLWGGLFTAITLGLEIACNHPQINYYLFLIILTLLVVEFIYSFKQKEIRHFFIASAILAGATMLAVAPNITGLWTTWEYGKESIRGKSELTQTKPSDNVVSTGLDKDYALAWSYGKAETFTVLIPNFQGGGSEGFDAKSETAKTLQQAGVQNSERVAQSLPAYWGDMPFTSGPVYFGAIVCFLFVMGLFVVKGPVKWWLLAATILSILLAWGRNFPILTNFFFYHFPLYNKFRTVSMILVIANLTAPLLGFLALKEIFERKISKEQTIKALKYSLGIVGGLTLIFALMPSLFFNFSSGSDVTLSGQLKSYGWPDNLIGQLLDAMKIDRASMLKADAWRSLLFILLAGGLIWAFIKEKVKSTWFAGLLIALMLFDLWPIDKRYLNNDHFVSKMEANNAFAESKADALIRKDIDPNYRVLNLTKSVFNDGYTPYFHKSIGGYHGAKLRRYQDMIDGPLSADIMTLQKFLSKRVSQDTLSMVLSQLPILNMLNTKYIIYNPDAMPLVNFHALGNAWFVKGYQLANDADQEYLTVKTLDPSVMAVVDKRFADVLSGMPLSSNDSITGTIKLLSYKPNDLVYESNNNKKQLAVFSEIYYAKGWNAYVDGKLVKYCRANYILRALPVPEGKHSIEFKFEPQSFVNGQRIALVTSVLIALLVLFALGRVIIKNRKEA
jgi:hypothetical protein